MQYLSPLETHWAYLEAGKKSKVSCEKSINLTDMNFRGWSKCAADDKQAPLVKPPAAIVEIIQF